jgi:hypothetical protein
VVTPVSADEQQFLDRIAATIQEEEEAAESLVLSDVPRGAYEGPLKTLIPVFFDVESTKTDEISIRKMTFREYLKRADLHSISIAIGQSTPRVYFAKDWQGLHEGASVIDDSVLTALRRLALDPRYVWVAFNASFDTRVLMEKCGTSYPVNVWCAMEGAMAAWPELPEGYSLDNCSIRLGLPFDQRKLKLNLDEFARIRERLNSGKVVKVSDLRDDIVAEFAKLADLPTFIDRQTLSLLLERYNNQDVVALREIYYRQIARLPECEQWTALRTHQQRRHLLRVDQENLDALIEELDKAAYGAEAQAMEYLTEAQARDVFNRDSGSLSSLRYLRLRGVINALKDDVDDEFASTSLKVISPVMLARNPTINAILEQTTRAGKMLHHKRRSAMFRGLKDVYCELGYARAHTFRFSSPSIAKGLNLHNCLAYDTLLLTNRGWVPILQLNKEDLLWDGIQYVPFARVTVEGTRSTIKVGAVEITPEHPVLSLGQKVPAGELTLYQQAQFAVDGLCSTLRGLQQNECESAVTSAAKKLFELWCISANLWDAADVPIDVPPSMSLPASQRTTWPSKDGDTLISCIADTLNRTDHSGHFRRELITALGCAKSGWSIQSLTMHTSKLFLAGMTEIFCSIASTISEGMNRETLDSYRRSIVTIIEEILSDFRPEKRSRNTASGSAFRTSQGIGVSSTDVFDIRGAGPRERFLANGGLVFNCPKHDVQIAKPVRRCFKAPEGMVLVRGDLANVEYRLEGWLTQCRTVEAMFADSVFADPYCQAWKAMTGLIITKTDPTRQVAKQAVLGLGFCMSPTGYAKVLLKVIASKVVTMRDLEIIVDSNGWGLPPDNHFQRIIRTLGCAPVIATTAYHIHRVFNSAHPEFSQTAAWLVKVMGYIAECPCGVLGWDLAQERINMMYESPLAPDRNRIGLHIDRYPFEGKPTVRVCCGIWPETVCWREPCLRYVGRPGEGRKLMLTVRKSNGLFKPFTPQLAIENVTQASARNALCMGLEQLDRLGYRDVIHIHDEVFLIVPRKREAVLAARDALLTTFGPNHKLPYGWAVLVKPKEITVTESLWEEESDVDPKVGDRWGKIERNDPDCLEDLP